ncbi:MAG: HEAT repeat domain-containing protein [Chloroflexota bacterium]
MSDLNGYLSQLQSKDASTRIATIKALKQFEDERVLDALKTIIEQDTSVPVIRTAILALGQLGSCDDLPLLLSLTKHESVWIRKASVQVIGQLRCHDAVSHLVNLLGDETLDALAREALVALKVDPDFF